MYLFSFFSRRNLLATLLASVLALLAVITVHAQTGTTSIRGTISDPNGASVPDAAVTLTSPQIGVTLSTKTDKEGAYQFLEIRPATYSLTVVAAGFATVKQANLQLLVATPVTNNITLQLASVATTVEVAAAAQTLNTTDATIGSAFNSNLIEALPAEGRDPYGILSSQPGVVTIADRDQVSLDQDSRGGAVNGARSDQSNLTLDGVDNNDQLKGLAFTGALRATLDSIEEFRVTTTNAGADQGRSSGAQVSLVTKSGTNQLHGTGYEYYRPKNLVANDYFNKHSELQNGEPNKPPSLLRNTFGGSFGGPIMKDRLFYFLAYEGQRTRENSQVTREVPSTLLREGIIEYQCATPSQCPGGTQQIQGVDATGLVPTTYTVNVPSGFEALGAPQIASMDPNCSGNGTCPWGPGIDPNVVATLNQYPQPDSNQLGYGYNFQAFTFSSPAPNKLDTYVAKFDYNLTPSGTQRLFARLGLQNDHFNGVLWFPGQPPSTVRTNNSKGIITGYAWTISPTKVNNLHYGFVRQGIGDNGSSAQQFVFLRGLATPVSDTRSTNVVVPVHNLTDDFSWTRGKHTFQFGGNWRFLNNFRNSNAQSFSDAITNVGFLPTTGFAGKGTSLDPGAFGFPAVDRGSRNAYDFPMGALAGIITESDATYQRDKNGNPLASPTNPGAFIKRHFRANEFETYLQDAWRIKSNLTFTYGVRYSLLQPPYEVNGNQVSPDSSLHDFFESRMKNMVNGVVDNTNFSMVLGGQANGKKPYWGWDYKNIAPRISLAWSPGYKDGLLATIFGGPGRSSLRVGAGVYYDHFGEGIVNTFDKNGSFGLTTTITDAPATVGVDDAPRYTGISNIPPSITPPGPTGAFPVNPPTADQLGGFAIYWGLDDKLKTPYSYGFDLSFSRELKGGFVAEAAYVGRLGRRLLQEKDLMQPLDLVDPASKVSYFQAATQFAVLSEANGGAGTDISQIPALPYWEHLFPGATGTQYSSLTDPVNGIGCGAPNANNISTLTASQAMYSLYFCNLHNETTALFFADVFGFPAFPTAKGCDPANGSLCYYQSQWASLYAWTSGGRSNYNALQLMLRHKASHGLSWDFNYTYSKSIDFTSDAERVNLFEGYGFGGGQVINAFSPNQMRGVSDFDMTHQINTSWLYEFPFGHGKRWGTGWNRAVDAAIGGWSLSGLGRWTSGLPFIVQNGFDFPTNWELNGFAVLNGKAPKTGVFTDCDGDPNIFAGLACSAKNDPGTFILGPSGNDGIWRFPHPGESGSRNNIRGPGYFGIDLGLRKAWTLTERTNLLFSWQVYNVTNSVRFDAANAFPTIDSAGSFGKYSNTLTRPRVMEFALRLSF
jgi:Carboxypeptidase regulatory-like domain